MIKRLALKTGELMIASAFAVVIAYTAEWVIFYKDRKRYERDRAAICR